MKIIKTKFKDLLILSKKIISIKGSLREIYNKKILNNNFLFEYCTISKANALEDFIFNTNSSKQNL